MNILIVGWYGTETIGDRAILASLIMHLKKLKLKMNITIGSIYPFYTERTILEDKELYINICGLSEQEIENINIIDSRNVFKLRQEIKSCDVVIIGGGPFDDMAAMFLLEYSFKKAKKCNKKTFIYGCGLNTLKIDKYKKCVKNIINLSDTIILRDENSKKILSTIMNIENKKINILIDPAVFIAKEYLEKNNCLKKENYVAINLRDFPEIYSQNKEMKESVNEKMFYILKNTLKEDDSVIMIPMHCFAIGGDDRLILNEFKYKIRKSITVCNEPLSLKQTFDYFIKAKYCIGTRFHSIVLQTILNGNNYVLNYTAPNIGKIPGFIAQINGKDFYQDRYIDLQGKNKKEKLIFKDKKFIYDKVIIENYEKIYLEELKKILN